MDGKQNRTATPHEQHRHFFLTAIASLLLASLPLAAPALRAEERGRVELLDALPGDALFVAVIEDFATAWDGARSTAWAAIVSDPSLRPLWRLVDTFLQEELGDEELTLAGLLDAVQGAAFFAGSREADDAAGLVLRLRPGRAPVEAVLRAYFERMGAEPGGRDVGFAWSQGVAVVQARDREQALQMAASAARALDSAVSDGTLSARLRSQRPSRPATFEAYLDVGSLITETVAPHGEEERRTFEALDLHDFGWGVVHFALGRGSAFELEARLELPRAGPWPLLAAHARPAPQRLAELAPAETIEVATLGYDVAGAWRSLRAWLAAELPDASEELERGLRGRSGATGIDLERQLLDQLSGEFARFSIPLSDDERVALNGAVVSLLFSLVGSPGAASGHVHLVGIEDVTEVAALVQRLIDLTDAGGRVEEDLVGGRTMRSFAVPELGLRPSWAFVDGAVVFSIYQGCVRAVLEQAAEDPPRAWITAERRAALRAGGTASGASVADLRGLVQTELVAPLRTLAELVARNPGSLGAADGSLGVRVDALSTLVEEHVRGTVHGTLAVDGRTLRYRLRAE